jgi:HlyD family secretion protein
VEERELLFRQASEEYKSAKFAEDIAKYELELAKAALIRTRSNSTDAQFEIRSPITGRVLRVQQESATIVTPGSPLVELGDPRALEIEIDVLSSDAVQVRPGAKVFLEQWGGENALQARVRLVEPSAFTKISALGVEEQRVNVIADFVDPPEARPTLGDQYRVEAKIVTWEKDDVLRVPTSALFRDGDEWSVFVVNDKHARLRTVKIGRRNSRDAEVLEGLTENEQVVLYHSDKLRDGVSVFER